MTTAVMAGSANRNLDRAFRIIIIIIIT